MKKVTPPCALLAEDEAILRAELKSALASLWPELRIVAEAEDGVIASQLLMEMQPDIVFLDVRMPGLSGIEVARLATHRCHVVFLTAYDEYAIKAFEHGAVDYLLKPLDLARLAVTVQRLKDKLHEKSRAQASGQPVQQAADLSIFTEEKNSGSLRWIQASSGNQLRFIDVNDVRCFRADAKYTKVETAKFEAHIRTAIKELVIQLNRDKFWQISRSAIINVAAIDAVKRVDNGLMLRLQDSDEWQAVSQAYQYQFRQM